MKNNKKAFSLAIAMGLVLITSLLAYAVLEYIIPFSKNIKGIENSTKSFYKAVEGIEEGLFFISNRSDLREEKYTDLNGYYSYSLKTYSSGSTLPLVGKGTSEINSDWNKLAIGEPIQLDIGNGIISNFSSFELYLKIPDLNGEDVGNLSLSGGELPIVNWQLSSDENSLNPYFLDSIENNTIQADEICDINNSCLEALSIYENNQGIDLYKEHSTNQEIDNFYNDNCISGDCSLKLSIVNNLETTDGQVVPYLEWKIIFDNNDKIPLRYTTLETSGVSYGFKKDLEIKIPQDTISEAFDFTVFQ